MCCRWASRSWGLHPVAAALVGDMVKVLAEKRQVIAATQSPLLVDASDLDETLVPELQDRRTKVHRYDESECSGMTG